MKLDIDLLKSFISGSRFDNRKTNILGNCPWCGFGEFGISTNDGHPFQCFRASKCGESGNIFKLLKKLDRLDLLNIVDKIDYSEKLENIISKKLESNEINIDIRTITPPLGFKRITHHPYLEQRGFIDYEKYIVGTTKLDSKLRDYVIFMIQDGGELKGFVSRSTHSKEYVNKYNESHDKKIHRYNNSTDTEFEKLLAGYDEITNSTNTIILVEGLFKKINIDKLLDLDSQEEIKCCVTFGAKISIEQIFKLQLKGIERIILMFDPDVINKIKKHSMELMREFETVQIGFHKSKSPDEFDINDLSEVLDNLQSPLNFFVKKVQVLNLK